MIQRIQTVYLIGAFVLTMLLFFFPVAQLLDEGGTLYAFSVNGIYGLQGEAGQMPVQQWPLVILLSIVLFVYATAVFLFKKRRLQMRLCIYNILLQAGMFGLLHYYLYRAIGETGATEHAYKLPVVIPILSMILTYLAFRSVRRDELMVQAADRIR